MAKLMNINTKVTKRMEKIKKEYAKDERVISYSGIIEMMLRETGRWELKKSKKSKVKK